MREIKFRAWDNEVEEFVYSDRTYDHSWFDFQEDTPLKAFSIHGDIVGTIWPPEPNVEELSECQMFTGLKDKNGKEIYEGDIVEQESVAFYPGEYGGEINFLYIGAVVILPSMGVCLKRPKCIDRLEENKIFKCNYYKNIVSYRSKIIGNIYETPKLIEYLEG